MKKDIEENKYVKIVHSVYYCDRCGEPLQYHSTFGGFFQDGFQCRICGGHFHENCRSHHSLFNGEELYEYGTYYPINSFEVCAKCLPINILNMVAKFEIKKKEIADLEKQNTELYHSILQKLGLKKNE
jgi:hypothetical protein